jgi:predicted ribosome quality control (RQC) complex YloA/Tae2 family protein
MKIELELDKSVEENASKYFEIAKKLKKKLVGAKAALEITKLKLEKEEKEQALGEEKKEKSKREKARKKEWYEKFRWFISSNGFLIIGGKDATSNEIVIKKHMDLHDLIYHSEAPGSPFIIIKNPENRTIQDATKKEAAIFAATFSKSWSSHSKRTEVFEVKPEQITKEAKSGEYIAKGAFMIVGQKKFYDVELDLAIGYFLDEEGCKVVMAGPHSAVEKKCKEYVKLRQGESKKGEISKLIMKKFNLATNDDILSSLPAGEFSVVK